MGEGTGAAKLEVGAFQALPPLPMPGFRETMLEVPVAAPVPAAGYAPRGASAAPGTGTGRDPARDPGKFARQTLAGLSSGFVGVIDAAFPRVLRINTVYRFKNGARLTALQRQADLLIAAVDDGFDPGLAVFESLARFLLVRGFVPAALAVLEAGSSRYPDDPALQALLAVGLFHVGQYAESGRLAAGVSAGPWAAEMRLLAAICRGRLDDAAGMAAGLAALVAIFAEDAQFLRFALPHLLQHGLRRDALCCLECLVRLEPGERAWQEILAGMFYVEEKFAKAARLLRRLAEAGRSSGERVYRLGICSAYLGAERAAAGAFRRVLRLPVDCGLDLDGLLAALGERGIGDDKLLPLMAIRAWRGGHFEACLRLVGKGAFANRLALVAARCRLSLKEPALALEILTERPVTIESLLPERDWLRAVACLRLDRLEEAAAAFAAARAAGHRRGRCAFQLGMIALRQGTPEAAVPLLREALGLGAPRYPVLRRLASAALAAGLPLAAGEALREILSLKPDCIGAYNNLGVLYAREGLLGQAGACFRKALERDPGNVFARDNLALVEKRSGGGSGSAATEGSMIGG